MCYLLSTVRRFVFHLPMLRLRFTQIFLEKERWLFFIPANLTRHIIVRLGLTSVSCYVSVAVCNIGMYANRPTCAEASNMRLQLSVRGLLLRSEIPRRASRCNCWRRVQGADNFYIIEKR